MTLSSSLRTRAAVAGTAAAALAVCLTVNVVDPNEPGSLGMCPFKWATGGLDCPGCGTLRATRALTRGDVVLAADHNLLFVVMVPLLVAAWMVWAVRAFDLPAGSWVRRAGQVTASTKVGWLVTVVVPVWWVLRNLPWLEWAASTAAV